MYYDQYNHPLLWCESKRRTEEKRIAEEGWIVVQQRKEQAEAKKLRDNNEVSEHNIACDSEQFKRFN